MARFTFFIGKGGVGKTTVSAAYALQRAATQPRSRILLLSTDPAHSLADILGTKLADSAKRLRTPGRLWARQLDSDRQIKTFLDRERAGILSLLNKGSLFTQDELEPLLDTSLPGMSEVAALLAIDELLAGDFDEVVVDTAPMGHTIRLFQMPQHFARFLDVLETAASRDVVLARHFGGRVRREPALDRWARMVDGVEASLSAAKAKLILVTSPEPFSLNEAARSANSFASPATQNQVAEIVLNRVVRKKAACPRCREKAAQSQAAHAFLRIHFPNVQVLKGEDPGYPILGIARLRAFGRHIFEGKKLSAAPAAKPPKTAKVQLEAAKWPALQTPLTLTLGKGGVGKTTISAALAFHHRQSAKAQRVTVCSIDPAPSLDDVFATKIGNQPKAVLRDRKLRAAEFDAMTEFQQWAGDLKRRLNQAMSGEERGIHVDVSLDRRFLLALLDVVPPGIDEIFATFKILDLLNEGGRVVIDMAPTGHALELLRTPARLLAWARLLLKTLAAHRTLPLAQDAAVEVAALSQNVRALAIMLRDGKRCGIVAVTLPEPLPDYETRRLLRDLKELGAPLSAVFINRVLIDPGRCGRCRLAAAWQTASLENLRRQVRGVEIFIAQELAKSIAGAEALKQFTRELWRIAPATAQARRPGTR